MKGKWSFQNAAISACQDGSPTAAFRAMTSVGRAGYRAATGAGNRTRGDTAILTVHPRRRSASNRDCMWSANIQRYCRSAANRRGSAGVRARGSHVIEARLDLAETFIAAEHFPKGAVD